MNFCARDGASRGCGGLRLGCVGVATRAAVEASEAAREAWSASEVAERAGVVEGGGVMDGGGGNLGGGVSTFVLAFVGDRCLVVNVVEERGESLVEEGAHVEWGQGVGAEGANGRREAKTTRGGNVGDFSEMGGRTRAAWCGV